MNHHTSVVRVNSLLGIIDMKTSRLTRQQLVTRLNEDLERDCVPSDHRLRGLFPGAEGRRVLANARSSRRTQAKSCSTRSRIAKHIDYLGGTPTTKSLPVKVSDEPTALLEADLENENNTIRNYRERVQQCEALAEYAIAEDIREILRQEQEHQTGSRDGAWTGRARRVATRPGPTLVPTSSSVTDSSELRPARMAMSLTTSAYRELVQAEANPATGRPARKHVQRYF